MGYVHCRFYPEGVTATVTRRVATTGLASSAGQI